MTLAPSAGTAGAETPAASRTGTRTVVRHTGHLSICPAWASSAESDARQM
jgi:hypothetical protein